MPTDPLKTPKLLETFGRDLELPKFSSGVQTALCNSRSAEVWSELIDEMLCFYTRHFSDRLNCALDYQIVGRKMFKAYPSIGRFGTHPWSALMSTLSSRMRTYRHKKRQRSGEAVSGKVEKIFDMRIEGEIKPEVTFYIALTCIAFYGFTLSY